mmetsp:Transcript_16925/g.21416  ORF Transcript_16925/g.21416 Transcript_16925/m.21416 type:complete len:184 (-) Transcript_16925:76-627(-)
MITDNQSNLTQITLSRRLQQLGSADAFEIIFGPSHENTTLSTIYETYESSFEDVDMGEEHIFTGAYGENEEIIHIRNKLFDSLPSMEWGDAVERIILSSSGPRRRRRPPNNSVSLIRKALDRRYCKETKSEAFEQLVLLDELLVNLERYNSNTKYLEKRLVLRARESQLRRRIFKLQANEATL